MWVMIISIVIPLLLKLFEYLRDKNANGELLTEREQRIVNRVNHAAGQVRIQSVKLGCLPDGEPEPVNKVAGGPLREAGNTLLPLTMEQFVELQRLLKLGDKASDAEWAVFEKSIGG